MKELIRKILLWTSLIATLFVAGIIFMATGKRPFDYRQANLAVGNTIFKVDIAENFPQQQRGLGGRESLPEEQGMYFIFDSVRTQSFWMLGMKFPLDIIWINGDRIIGYEENVPLDTTAMPKIYNSPAPADKVLEINAGLIAKYGLKVGDTVAIK